MSTIRFGDIELQRADHIATLTIDRPAKLNSVPGRFWRDLREALAACESDGETRFVILTGAGDRAFCAGGDIGEFAEMDGLHVMRDFQIDAMAGFTAIERSPLTVMAAVNGIAMGGGCELTLACDFAIASDNAVFALPEGRLGLAPGFGVIRAPEVMGRGMAKFLLATGGQISAQRAYEVGLVQKVVPQAELMDEAMAIARQAASYSPLALAVGKKLMNRQIDQVALDYSVEAITVLHASTERQEAVNAFLASRKKG
jgi:enoyl-CoA hydratase